ncbi:aldo/keto reductase [Nocardioides sp. GY 10127]|uniref:aldo/keto reductase n=1 Tax=Nocardioides sp. GY 10127 TaxID=2569762 RepID=UPI0010A8A4EA|nr:aldo/keto reductase [Nocardioides sp. GY 10127]TIC86420.1 aldo/keto reductase [Nocardioides sp. GY 10127]
MATLGSTGIDLFPLVLGTNNFGWTSQADEAHAILDAFADGGGTLVDTADSYSAWVPGHTGGESETVIGQWIARGNRDRLMVGTKVSQHPDFQGLSAANVRKALDASLQRLRTDHVDVYWAHFDDESVPLEETVAAFEEARLAGKTRFVAVSNYSAERIEEWVAIARREGFAAPVALQPHYNLVVREPYESTLAPVAAAHDLGVTPYWSLAAGFLTGKYRTREDLAGTAREQQTSGYFSEEGLAVVDVAAQVAEAHSVSIAAVALAWLAGRPQVAAPIASARTTEQLADLMQVGSLQLTAEETAALDDASAKVPAQN